ncbi:O-antigen ligase family protein [Solimonas marina]|uniref:O-antigen ligase family protein n=1 Tax=Solimonas marina TaxID=2714601 RepID=A0A970B5Z7_9GAMM|nr:O-antigen ligase family protein [Solimonas marina]NKF23917.1 O-antigen ligase family protein [Solimonas marina]
MKPFFLLLSILAAYSASGLESKAFLQTWYDEARFFEILGFLAILSCLFVKPPSLQSPSRMNGLLAAFVLLGIASSLRSNLPLYGLIEVTILCSAIIVGTWLGRAASNAPSLKIQIIAIIATGGVILGIRLATNFFSAYLTGDGRGLSSAWLPFIGPRFFAKAATWTIPLLWVAPWLTEKYRGAASAICTIASVATWAFVIGTGSRGALVGLAIGMAAIFILFGHVGRRYAIHQLLVAASAFALWQVFAIHFDISTADRIVTAGLSGRESLYTTAWADIHSSPLLGIGPMQYAMLGRHPGVPGAGPHDFPLQFAAEWGIPAFLILCLLIVRWLVSFAVKIRSEVLQGLQQDARIDLAIFAGAVAALVHGLVANVFNDPVSQLLAVTLVGLSLTPKERQRQLAAGSKANYFLASVTSAACIAGLLASIALGWRCINPSPEVQQMPKFGGTVSPRLWSQGLIPFNKTCSCQQGERPS